ncbi:MAG TPA: twin-arginine translocase subunit TatC [Phycisphaerae bacterium]|nr:twin-arginine translocase subunit TatC [Phycisphaerae bacterium]
MPDGIEEKAIDTVELHRMSFGEHLEELRTRVIRALLGLVASGVLCYYFGEVIIETLTAPYYVAMRDLGFEPQMVQLNPTESFLEYFKISLEFGLVLAAPWVLYQLWQFVAAGLYPHEKRLVRLFAPVSMALFVIGASFMVVVVLTGLMHFLIGFSKSFPLPSEDNLLVRMLQDTPEIQVPATQPGGVSLQIPVVTESPSDPAPGSIWFNERSRKLYVRGVGALYEQSLVKSSASQFVQPFFSISEYLGFVVNLALAFGLGFQIPIVVVFLIMLDIVPSARMSAARKYIILAIAIGAAVLTPSPDIGTMLLLMVPMILLFEMGLVVGRVMSRRRAGAS